MSSATLPQAIWCQCCPGFFYLDPSGLRPHDGLAMTITVHEEGNASTVVSFHYGLRVFLFPFSNSSSGPHITTLWPYDTACGPVGPVTGERQTLHVCYKLGMAKRENKLRWTKGVYKLLKKKCTSRVCTYLCAGVRLWGPSHRSQLPSCNTTEPGIGTSFRTIWTPRNQELETFRGISKTCPEASQNSPFQTLVKLREPPS